jgi:alpha-1,6-mannosyltransferase
MKIVDIAEFYSERGGGFRTYIQHKLAASRREGHQTVIIAPGPEDREEPREGGKIVWVKAPRLPVDPRYHIFVRSGPVNQVLQTEQPDVIEGSSPWLGGWIAARWRGPVVKSWFVHHEPVATYPQTLLGRTFGRQRVDEMCGWFWGYLRRLSALFDLSVVSSRWLADRLEGFGLARPQVVPFGIDKRLFSPARRDAAMRRRMLAACGIADETAPLLVAISRHHPEKRVGTMIDAFAEASRARPMGFFLVGDGPIRGWIEHKAARVPGAHVAGIIADRDELATCLASADAFMHGCASETFGLVMAEAVCAGLPLVVPDFGGAADLAHSTYAETYEAGNAAAGAAAIRRLLARDPVTLGRAAARAAVERIGTMDDHFRGLFALYQQLVDERRWGKKPALLRASG